MFKASVIKKDNPYLLTFIASLAFSYLAISTDNLLNHDGIYFMDAAKTYLRDGIAALFKVFPWPFFSWLVANVHQISWFPHIEQTAHFINALLIATTCILFIRIYAEITNNEGSLWVAAVLVLTLVGVNKYRADVMKDFGYWCFYLAGFYSLLRYYKRPSWAVAIGWQIFTGLAVLFRIEGLVVVAMGPLVLFFKNVPLKERVIQTARLYSIYIIGLIGLLIAMVFVDTSRIDVQLGRLSTIVYHLNIDSWIKIFNSAVRKVGEIYWYEGSHDKHYHVLAIIYASSLFIYVLIKIVECLSFPYFLVFLYGSFKKHYTINNYNKIILYFVALWFLFFIVYQFNGKVISSRYTTSLVLLLLLLTGQVVERLIPAISNSRHRKKIVSVVFIYLFINTIDSVISTQGDSKTHVLQSGYWIQENVDRAVPVYSNYYKTLYYTDRGLSLDVTEFGELLARIENGVLDLNVLMEFGELVARIESNTLGQDAYMIFKIDQEESEAYAQELERLAADGKIEYMIEFSNDDHDRSVIYKLISK
jgi:hypothetical protein